RHDLDEARNGHRGPWIASEAAVTRRRGRSAPSSSPHLGSALLIMEANITRLRRLSRTGATRRATDGRPMRIPASRAEVARRDGAQAPLQQKTPRGREGVAALDN